MFRTQASIKRRRKGGRPRGSPPPPAEDAMTAATDPELATPDVNHNLTVVATSATSTMAATARNINNINKRSRDDNFTR